MTAFKDKPQDTWLNQTLTDPHLQDTIGNILSEKAPSTFRLLGQNVNQRQRNSKA